MNYITWTFNKRGSRRKFVSGEERNFTNDIESLVRESIQNSNDARQKALEKNMITKDKPCIVNFQYLEIIGKQRAKFINKINSGKQLSSRLKASKIIRHDNSDIDKYFDVYSNSNENSFSLFVIHDFNTTGLYGAELGDDDSPFSALCRDSGLSQKTEIGSKGGSYGMGKSVFWKFSDFNTVLFLSYTINKENNNRKEYRLFGLSDLGSHKLQGKEYDGVGEFGKRILDQDDEKISGDYGKSVWSTNIDSFDFIPKAIRDKRRGKVGTSIIILGFHEFKYNNSSINDLKINVYKWFWPLITLNKLFVHVDNNEMSEKLSIDNIPDEFLPFKIIFDEIIKYKDEEIPKDVILHDQFQVSFPSTDSTDVNSKYIYSNVNLFLKKISTFPDIIDESMKNNIAWMRGSFSIVKYYKKNSPIGSEGYFGLLLAGSALEIYISDLKDHHRLLDDFLRYSETPSHDDWSWEKSQLKDIYGRQGGAKKSLKYMLQKFSDLNKLLDYNQIGGNKVPLSLARMFPGVYDDEKGKIRGPGGPGGGTTSGRSNLIIKYNRTERTDEEINMEIEVSHRNNKNNARWKILVLPRLLDEDKQDLGNIYTPITIKYEGKTIEDNVTGELDGNHIIEIKIKIPDEYKESLIDVQFKEVN